MIVINNEKAIELTKNKIRAWRDIEFKKNDVAIQNAIVDGNEVAKAEAAAYRDYLRDLPAQCDGKTLDELKAMLVEKGV